MRARSIAGRIFQPEIAADAVHEASLHPRREIFLGWPSIKTRSTDLVAHDSTKLGGPGVQAVLARAGSAPGGLAGPHAVSWRAPGA